MMTDIPITSFDLIFISYDEDNAEQNWADLKKKCPWAKRVHGIYGSDAAHKKAAEVSESERFVTCDGDTVIKPEFLKETIPSNIADDKTKTISWCSENSVNGLVYGNGGLKCWTKYYVENMRTHENSDKPINRIEFCFEDGYTQMNECLSITHPNGSPRQLWRSGFREGVKMTLDQGFKQDAENLCKLMYWKNLIRLLVWCSVGADSKYGLWAMYGARLGCYMTNLTDWDYVNVRDFEYLNDMWEREIKPKFESFDSSDICISSGFCWNNDKLKEEIKFLGEKLRSNLNLEITELDEQASRFFKQVFVNPKRIG
jgi:hypothetical protein